MAGNSQPGRADKDALYRVAYDEAMRALSEQRVAVDSLRSRAGLLFSAAAITTSFLGAQALGDGESDVSAWLALAAFVGVAVTSLAILWPRSWEFATNLRDLIQRYIEAERPAPIGKLHRELSLHMHRGYLENWKGLSRLVTLFQIASALLSIEVILWIAAITSTA